ncbi:hypothetical protein SSX86_008530 [Deinandra increscens subsp. villosa]|uniref:Uncharacterized protein n=1 Tax=Deinandra increscens subsp. villosa TaxID=3103831 RepID=A0AAP0DJA3_9ASTR
MTLGGIHKTIKYGLLPPSHRYIKRHIHCFSATHNTPHHHSSRSGGDRRISSPLPSTTMIMMKLSSSALVASVLAASTAALSSSSHFDSSLQDQRGRTVGSEKGKFAPGFDGLRFIETLVTAHK